MAKVTCALQVHGAPSPGFSMLPRASMVMVMATMPPNISACPRYSIKAVTITLLVLSTYTSTPIINSTLTFATTGKPTVICAPKPNFMVREISGLVSARKVRSALPTAYTVAAARLTHITCNPP